MTATELRTQWQEALGIARAATTDDEYDRAWEAEQAAYELWADAADEALMCLQCGGPSPDHAYCPEYRAVNTL